jgi:hypothetical protein
LGILANKLSKAGWNWGCAATVDSNGRTFWTADAHRDDGKRFVAHAGEKLTAFLELEAAIRNKKTNSQSLICGTAAGSGAGAELGVGAPFSLGAVDSV